MTDKPTIAISRQAFTKFDATRSPTALDVRQRKAEVYEVLRDIPTTLGGGNHGHMGMAMTPAEYRITEHLQPGGAVCDH